MHDIGVDFRCLMDLFPGGQLAAGASNGANAASRPAHASATNAPPATPAAAADGGFRVAGHAGDGVHAAPGPRRPLAPISHLGAIHGHARRLQRAGALLAREGGGRLLPWDAASLRHGHAVQQPGAHGYGAEPAGVAPEVAQRWHGRPAGRGRAPGARFPPPPQVAAAALHACMQPPLIPSLLRSCCPHHVIHCVLD